MPLTPIYSLPYPALSDAPDGPAQMQSLANATETAIKTQADRLTVVETRHGVILQQSAAQAVLANTLSAIGNFAVLGSDPDGYFDGAVAFDRIKIPVGLGGTYVVGFRYQASAGSNGRAFAELIRNGVSSTTVRGSFFGDDTTHGAQPIVLAAGDFFKLQALSLVAHNTVVTGTQMYAWRIGN